MTETDSSHNKDVSATRNSSLRNTLRPVISRTTELLHRTFPNLTPDHITATGNVGVAIAAVLAIFDHPKSGAAIGAVSQLTDAFDGSLARLKDRENPGSIDFKKGQLTDSQSDRKQELITAISRARTAKNRGDLWGEIAALTAAATNGLPSVSRANAEKNGIPVSESGIVALKAVGILGTRVGRAVTGLVGMALPTIKDVPIQAPLDTITAVLNLSTAIDRYQSSKHNSPSDQISQETRAEAAERLRMLVGMEILAVGAAALVFVINRASDHSKSK